MNYISYSDDIDNQLLHLLDIESLYHTCQINYSYHRVCFNDPILKYKYNLFKEYKKIFGSDTKKLPLPSNMYFENNLFIIDWYGKIKIKVLSNGDLVFNEYSDTGFNTMTYQNNYNIIRKTLIRTLRRRFKLK